MNPAIERMLSRYPRDTLDQNIHALREILQQLVLLGLWRGKFFDRAAFYGGTALRILYGIDRFSEDLDFSLLATDRTFSLAPYGPAVKRELTGFGFDLTFESAPKRQASAIESAFVKANTVLQLLVIDTDLRMLGSAHRDQKLRIRLEVDTDPPGGFSTHSAPILQPIPFAVRAHSLPDLFAGKVHALLCRKWRTRVKGRDWFDFVWYAANHPQLHLAHLEQRMRQSGDYHGASLTMDELTGMIRAAVSTFDVRQVREEVRPFLRDPGATEIWSREFFTGLIALIEIV